MFNHRRGRRLRPCGKSRKILSSLKTKSTNVAGGSLENFPNPDWLVGILFPRLCGLWVGFWAPIPAPASFQGLGLQSPIQALQLLPSLLLLLFLGPWIESQLWKVRNSSGNSPTGNGAGPGPAAARYWNLIFPALIPFGMGFAGLNFVWLIPEASQWLQRRILLWFPWNSRSSERCRNVWRSCGITSAVQSLNARGVWATGAVPDSSGNSFGMSGMKKQWDCSACRIPGIGALRENRGLQLEGF